MGKTNLIDAIYYACIGKSYFSSRDKNVVHKGQEFFRIEANFENNYEVVIKVKPGKLKAIVVNDIQLEKISDHIGTLPVVMISPIDIQLLLEGSESRRLFMNNTIGQYSKSYMDNLLVYNRLLRQRNALLKSFQEKRTFNADLLSAISDKMLEPAHMIHIARAEFVTKLQPVFKDIYNQISGGNEIAAISYKSLLNKKSMQDIFTENIEKDRVMARTTVGPHKDDIKFDMNDDLLKTFASQGQLKSFVLSLKLAQYNILNKIKDIKPILLLDDLFDKLDKQRVKQLLELLTKPPYDQVMITDTSVDRVPDIIKEMGHTCQVIRVEHGKCIH
jgi:DNA replication and repair protein RecF